MEIINLPDLIIIKARNSQIAIKMIINAHCAEKVITPLRIAKI
jgi:hypothetical protein